MVEVGYALPIILENEALVLSDASDGSSSRALPPPNSCNRSSASPNSCFR